jgi:hypothetical protein
VLSAEGGIVSARLVALRRCRPFLLHISNKVSLKELSKVFVIFPIVSNFGSVVIYKYERRAKDNRNRTKL